MAIDYGQKRAGLAVTDPLCMIAGGLDTVHVKDIWNYLDDYLSKEDVKTIVVGYPKKMNNEPSEAVRYIKPFINKLNKKYPAIKIEKTDERFTSKMALQAMIDGGMKKMKRRDKATIDKVSATIILQSYLESINNK